jgi:hypothetical protein
MRPDLLCAQHDTAKPGYFWLIVLTVLSLAGHVAAQSAQGNSALSISPTADGALLHCDFQKLHGNATREGLWLTSTARSDDQPFRVTAISAARETETAAPVPETGSVSVHGSLVQWKRVGITEEYSATMDGLRQDFIITERPVGIGYLRLKLHIDGAEAKETPYGIQLKLNSSGRNLAYSSLRAVDNEGKELSAWFEVRSATEVAVAVDDSCAVYPVRIDPTFSDANWVSLGGLPGTSGMVSAIVVNTNAGLVYVGGTFAFAGGMVVSNVAVWNGTNWSALGRGVRGAVNALALDGAGNLYVGGALTNAGGLPVNRVAKWDGNSWSSLSSGLNNTVNALAVDAAGNLYAGGFFTASGDVPVANVAKWDGNGWSALGSGMNSTVYALSFDGSGNLYVGGDFTTAGGLPASRVAVWNGSAWTAVGAGVESRVYALVVGPSSTLYIGGSFSTAGGAPAKGVAAWNGSTWSPVGSGTLIGIYVNALALDQKGNLYVGGAFTGIGGLATSGIAKWDGNSWSAVGSGLGQSGSQVNALAFDGLGNLYAGGNFTAAYFSPADYIARWNGSAWSKIQEVGTKLGGRVFALAVDDRGSVYAGGDSAPAKWDGTNWVSLGSGMTGAFGQTPGIHAMVWTNGMLYAGGAFASIGGVSATNLARWDGNVWSAIDFDGGANGWQNYVNALAVDGTGNLYEGSSDVQMWDGHVWSNLGLTGSVSTITFDRAGILYAGGYIESAGSVTNDHVAQWNGSTWSPVGSGINGNVNSMVADRFGNLYAAGGFSLAGGIGVTNIAKWDGNSWAPLSSGIPGLLVTLAVDPFGRLYAGGVFSKAGGISVSDLAQWDGAQWSALGAGANGSVRVLLHDGAGRLYAGGYLTAAGTACSQYAVEADVYQGLGNINTISSGDGLTTMSLPGPQGATCLWEASTNLSDWITVSTNVCGTNNLWTFTNSVSGPQRFFRAVLP